MGGQPCVEDPIQFGRVHASKNLVEDQVAGDTADFGRSARARQSEAPALDLAVALGNALAQLPPGPEAQALKRALLAARDEEAPLVREHIDWAIERLRLPVLPTPP